MVEDKKFREEKEQREIMEIKEREAEIMRQHATPVNSPEPERHHFNTGGLVSLVL